MMIWLLLLQLVTWERVFPPVLHQGTWQSCNGGEEALEHVRIVQKPILHAETIWELHLGPYDEFALYDHRVDGEGHAHDTPDNLLGSDYRLGTLNIYRGARQWSIPRLHLWISVVRAGGSRDECQSFFIRIEKK